MGIYLDLSAQHKIESANYITFIEPGLHPSRIMPFHDFLYIIDGTWTIREENKVYELQSDDLLILSADRHHYGVAPCSANNRHMYVHIFPGLAELSCLQTDTNSPSATNELTCFQQLFHCQHNPKVKELLQEIIEISWGTSPIKETHISSLITSLLCELYEMQSASQPQITDIVKEITSKLRRSPQTFFSSSEIAQEYSICERTLNNHFKKVYGMTFSNYQMTTKLEGIRHYILAHPDAKLADVAKNYGFCDEYHLGKAYKNKYGISPKKHCSPTQRE
ncbi:MAG: AraC family transcriptional regulator [Eubacterium sp.]|nr:AraC family transcriptional regulator [Eubacterium sp.]